MGESDRLKRLRELRKALESEPPGIGSGAPGDTVEADPAPQVGARPSGAGAPPADALPQPRLPDPFPPAGMPSPGPGERETTAFPGVFPTAPAPARPRSPASVERPAIELPREPAESRPPLPGTVPGTAAELPADTRGPAVLAFLDGLLSPLAALESGHILAASGVLFVVTLLVALQMLQSSGDLRVLFLPPVASLLPPALRALSTALFHVLIIPGIRVRLAGVQWSERQRRAQVEVTVSGDMPLAGNWRRSVRVSLGSRGAPAKPLSVGMVSYDAGSKRDLALLMEAPPYAVDAVIVRVTCPDGRKVGLDAPIQRWGEAKCGRCQGEDPACPLCGGTGQVREAML